MSVVVNAATDRNPRPGAVNRAPTSRKRRAVSQAKVPIGGCGPLEKTRECITEAMDCFPAVGAAVWQCTDASHELALAVSRDGRFILEGPSLVQWADSVVSGHPLYAARDVPFITNGPRIRDEISGCFTETFAISKSVRRDGWLAALVTMLVLKEPGEVNSIQRSLLNLISQTYFAELDSTAMANELAQANMKISQLQAHKEWFVPAAAHYLRTPLTSIKGLAQLMTRDPNSFSITGNRKPGTILIETDRLVDTINDLIGLESMEKSILSLNPAEMDLGALLHSVVGSADSVPALKNRVLLSMPSAAMPVWIDQGETKQALTAVICSLALSTGDISKIHLSAAPSEEGACISIRMRVSRVIRDDWEKMLSCTFSMDGEINHSRHAIARDIYVARNIIEAQGGQISLYWKKSGDMDLLIQFPASTQPRGKR